MHNKSYYVVNAAGEPVTDFYVKFESRMESNGLHMVGAAVDFAAEVGACVAMCVCHGDTLTCWATVLCPHDWHSC